MNDSPMPMSPPAIARRKNRSSWIASVASRSDSIPTCRAPSAIFTVSVPPLTSSSPAMNAAFAHLPTIRVASSPRSIVAYAGTPFAQSRSACQ